MSINLRFFYWGLIASFDDDRCLSPSPRLELINLENLFDLRFLVVLVLDDVNIAIYILHYQHILLHICRHFRQLENRALKINSRESETTTKLYADPSETTQGDESTKNLEMSPEPQRTVSELGHPIKPRRSKGTEAYRARNRFASAAILVGSLLGVAWM